MWTVDRSAVLLLPEDAFPAGSSVLRARLEQAWRPGKVEAALVRPSQASLVILVSHEAPGLFATRLRQLVRSPLLEGKLLAAWCLAGRVRQDLPADLLAESGLAGLGLAEASMIAMQRAPDELVSMRTALTESGRRVEELPGPFLWYF